MVLFRFFYKEEQTSFEEYLKNKHFSTITTTQEKANSSSYQIVKGFLYYTDCKQIYRYDYQNQKSEVVLKKDVSDFLVLNDVIIYTSISDDSGYLVSMFDMQNKADVMLVSNIDDYIIKTDKLYYIKHVDNSSYLYQYNYKSKETEELTVVKNDKTDGAYEIRELVSSSGDYIFFKGSNENCLFQFNIKTKAIKTIFSGKGDNNEQAFCILDVIETQDKVVVQGKVINTIKTSIDGPYEEKDAKERGIWVIEKETGEKKHYSTEVFYEGLFLLDNHIYVKEKNSFKCIM